MKGLYLLMLYFLLMLFGALCGVAAQKYIDIKNFYQDTSIVYYQLARFPRIYVLQFKTTLSSVQSASVPIRVKFPIEVPTAASINQYINIYSKLTFLWNFGVAPKFVGVRDEDPPQVEEEEQ